MHKGKMRSALGLLLAIAPLIANAYQPDPAQRKTLSQTAKRALVQATPAAQRLSVRLSFSPMNAFREYERLAQTAGFAPYEGCSIAAFAGVTNWRLVQGTDATPAQIAGLVKQCQESAETTLGAKPISQTIGDREILRGIWQRNLEFVARNLRDDELQSFLRNDATAKFRSMYGEPDQFELTDEGFRAVAAAASQETGRAQSDASATASADAGEQPATLPKTSPANTSTARATPKTEGNRQEVERIVLRTVTRYGLSGVYIENETYLLLKDGAIRRNFVEDPHTMDFAASRRSQAKNWGRWRDQGSALQVTWPGKKPSLWKTWFATRPAAPAQTIEGRFQSADGFGGGRVANFNTIALSADGRFSWASLKGGSTGGWLPAYSDRRRAGRYELDGHAIRLQYNDGATERYFFCFYPKDDQHFVIGGNHFTPLD